MKSGKRKTDAIWTSPRGKVSIGHPGSKTLDPDNYASDAEYSEALVSRHLLDIERRAKSILKAEGIPEKQMKDQKPEILDAGGSVVALVVLDAIESMRLVGEKIGYGPRLTELALGVGEMAVMMEIAHQDTLHNKKEGRPLKLNHDEVYRRYESLMAKGKKSSANTILAKEFKVARSTIRSALKRVQKKDGN